MAKNMERFRIPVRETTTTKSIRFPDSVLSEVEQAIAGRDCTLTAFVVAAVKAALSNLEDNGEE